MRRFPPRMSVCCSTALSFPLAVGCSTQSRRCMTVLGAVESRCPLRAFHPHPGIPEVSSRCLVYLFVISVRCLKRCLGGLLRLGVLSCLAMLVCGWVHTVLALSCVGVSHITLACCRVRALVTPGRLRLCVWFFSPSLVRGLSDQMSDCDPEHVPSMKHETRMQIQHCNWQVLNCTTAANYYHALRRQVRNTQQTHNMVLFFVRLGKKTPRRTEQKNNKTNLFFLVS